MIYKESEFLKAARCTNHVLKARAAILVTILAPYHEGGRLRVTRGSKRRWEYLSEDLQRSLLFLEPTFFAVFNKVIP